MYTGKRAYRGMDSWLSEAMKKIVQPKAASIVEKAKAKAIAPLIKIIRVEQPQITPEAVPASRLPLYLGIGAAVAALVMFLRGRK